MVEIVDALDLSELEVGYEGRGKTAYHPAMLVAMLFYGYATGVFSSRMLERATYDSVAMRYITADTHPDHDTIAHFRKRFLVPLERLFVQILGMAQAMGVLRVGTVSLDGTKVKANASKHKAMSWAYANRLEAQLREEVRTLMERAAQRRCARGRGSWTSPRSWRVASRGSGRLSGRRRRWSAGRRSATRQSRPSTRRSLPVAGPRRQQTGRKARGREPKAPQPGPRDKDQVNFTDEESRIVPSSQGFVQGYNAQAAVDTESHLVVAEHVSQSANDKQEMAPALERLDAVRDVIGKPGALLADAGYLSEGNVKRCEAAGIEPSIASGRERHNVPLARAP